MKKVLFSLQVLWAWWYFFIFAFIFLVLYPLFYIFLLKEKWYRHANTLRIFWARMLFLLTGIFPSIRYETRLVNKGNFIFCPNHFSYLDIPMSALVAGPNWRFMAKMELKEIPIFNIFFKTVDISVDRENARESFKAVHEASVSMDRNFNIVIYPEGTIGSHPPKLLRFKNGPFKLAIEKQVPIVPVTFIDNWKLLYVNGWKLHGRPGRTRVVVHQPVSTAGLTISDLPAIKEKIFSTIEQELKKHYSYE